MRPIIYERYEEDIALLIAENLYPDDEHPLVLIQAIKYNHPFLKQTSTIAVKINNSIPIHPSDSPYPSITQYLINHIIHMPHTLNTNTTIHNIKTLESLAMFFVTSASEASGHTPIISPKPQQKAG